MENKANEVVKMSENVVSKGLETLANVTKLAANVTNPANKQPKKEDRRQDNRDNRSIQNPHNQTVEVKVGQENPKPQIIEQKPEIHIHRHFPDNRALTLDECKIEEMRLKLEFEEKDKERQYKLLIRKQDVERLKEIEADAKKERQERERKAARKRKIRYIIGGIAGVGLVGLTAYCWYTDSRRPEAGRNNMQLRIETGSCVDRDASTIPDNAVQGEGKVE